MTFPLMPTMVPAFISTPTVTYVTHSSTNLGGTFTVPSPTSTNRFIVYVTSNQNGTVNLASCTMNGIVASVASSGNASFACAAVPTGTSIVITPTYVSGGTSGTSSTSSVYVVYGLESTIWRSVAFNAGNPATASVLVPENGIILAPVQIDNDNQTALFTTGMTKDVDADNGSSRGLAHAHHNAFTSAQAYTVTCTVSTTNGVGNYMGVGVLR